MSLPMWGVSFITDLSHFDNCKMESYCSFDWHIFDGYGCSVSQPLTTLLWGSFLFRSLPHYLIALFGFPIFCPYVLVFNNLIGSDFMIFILLLTHIRLFVFYWETEQELIQMREEGGRTGRRRGPGNQNKYNIREENIYFIKMTKKEGFNCLCHSVKSQNYL